MYRLAYYNRFDLNVIDLNFSVESFVLLPVVILFSDFIDLLLSEISFISAVLLIAAIIAIYIIFRAIQTIVQITFNAIKSRLQKVRWAKDETDRLHNLILKYNLLEILLTIFILFILFGIAWYRGFVDGNRDIYIGSTVLPKVKLIAHSKEGLPPTGNFREKDWRLLHRHDDWIYLVSPKEIGEEKPPEVLLVTKGETGDKILVLKPAS